MLHHDYWDNATWPQHPLSWTTVTSVWKTYTDAFHQRWSLSIARVSMHTMYSNKTGRAPLSPLRGSTLTSVFSLSNTSTMPTLCWRSDSLCLMLDDEVTLAMVLACDFFCLSFCVALPLRAGHSYQYLNLEVWGRMHCLHSGMVQRMGWEDLAHQKQGGCLLVESILILCNDQMHSR